MTAAQPQDNDPQRQTNASLHGGDDADRVIASDELFDGKKQVLIQHDGEVYRLFRTRNNKLLLQK